MKRLSLILLILINIPLIFSGCKTNDTRNAASSEIGVVSESATSDLVTDAVSSETENETPPSVTVEIESKAETKVDGQLIGSFERGGKFGSMKVYINSSKLSIYDSNLSPIQSIQLFSEMDSNSIITNFKAEDINFDGFTDIGVINLLGTANAYYDYYLWDSKKGSFTYYEPLSEISSPLIKPDSKTIYSYTHISAASFTENTYRWINGKLTIYESIETEYDENGNGTVTTKTYDENGNPISNDTVKVN